MNLEQEAVVQPNGEVRQAGSDLPGREPQAWKLNAEKSLYFMAKGILGWKELVPHLHGAMCSLIQTIPPRFKLFLVPRGCFKTTLSESLGLHIIIQPKEHNLYFPNQDGRNTRILYVGETDDMAQARTSWVRRQLESNKLFRAFWPQCTWEDPRKARVTWNNSAFVVPRTQDFPEATFECVGVGGASTGHHYDVMIKDDLVAIEAMRSAVKMAEALTWHLASRNMRNDPETWLEFIFGTRWGAFDLYQNIIENDNMETGGKVKVYLRRMVEDGKSIFPERYTLEDINEMHRDAKDAGEEYLFFLNQMNTVTGSGLTDFDMEKVRYFEMQKDQGEMFAVFAAASEDRERAGYYDPKAEQTVEEQMNADEALLFEQESGSLKGQKLTADNYRVLRGHGRSGLMLKFS